MVRFVKENDCGMHWLNSRGESGLRHVPDPRRGGFENIFFCFESALCSVYPRRGRKRGMGGRVKERVKKGQLHFFFFVFFLLTIG